MLNMLCQEPRLPGPPGCGRGVWVASGVALFAGVGVVVIVAVLVGVGVRVAVLVGVGVAVLVGVGVGVAVLVGVGVGVVVLVGVGVFVLVAVGEGVMLGVPVLAAGVCRMRYSRKDCTCAPQNRVWSLINEQIVPRVGAGKFGSMQ